MLKKTITYTDYDGIERTEDFYFNLSKAELMEKQLATPGGYAEMLKNIVDAKDSPALIKIFKELVLDSYGEKSADGKHFIKNERIREEFASTEAYSELFMSLATDSGVAAEFVNGILPKDFAASDEEIKKAIEQVK